jgi:dimethylargininase
VFPEWPVTGIAVSHPVLHFKSMSSMCGVDTIAISDSDAGRKAWREIESLAHFKRYKPLVFPDDNGANCLFINGTVLHPPEEEYPESYKVWQTVNLPRVEVPNSEMAKADGSLTCNSIRIQ